MTHALHITLAQINPVVGNLDYNLEKIRAVIAKAPAQTDLIVFPELAICGYPPEDLVLKPSFMDEVEKAVRKLARESKNFPAHIVIGAPWRGRGKIYNAVHLIGGGKIVATRRKRHLPNYGVFDEPRLFAAGPMPGPVDLKGHKLGLMICEDTWHADVAAHLKKKGADILISVNASPYEITKHPQRLEKTRARVQETGLPLIYVNQCGGQDELVFDGASFILSQGGNLVLQAEEFIEDIHYTTWEKGSAGQWLCLTDKTIPACNKIESIYRALMTGLRDYVTKNGFPGVLIGLSGGIDSALSAAIAVDALGHDAVHGVMMPSVFTSRESLEDAAALAKNLKIHCDTIPIVNGVTSFEQAMAPHFTANTPATTHENIQPRCRGIILMALSNAVGKLVLSTGNKSEIAVGYATLYGDMCGGFNVLKDIYKTKVYELARWRNAHRPAHGLGPAGSVIPGRSLTKAPTAELKPDQTDQDTLPPYDILDGILEGMIEGDMGLKDLAARGYDAATIKKVRRILDAAEYKRRQAPPGVKITSRAFGRDRRYPITNGFKG